MRREWLITIRKSNRLTQKQVASAGFINRGYYSQIEIGKRNPSLVIAANIAKVLNFNELMFFQDLQNNSSFQDNVFKYTISDHFRIMVRGEVLYLYSSPECYFQHLITFLLMGVENGSHCLIIDDHKNYDQIEECLRTTFKNSDAIKSIHFINKEEVKYYEPIKIVNEFQALQNNGNKEKSIRIWMLEEPNDKNEWINKLENYINTDNIKLSYKNILLTRTYNASMVSAAMYNELMKVYPYIMTDYEIVNSPFYNQGNKSLIFPSLVIQENM